MQTAIKRLWRSTSGLAAILSASFALATLMISALAYEVTHEALEKQLDHRTATETRALLSEPGSDRLAAIAAAIRRRERIAGFDHLGYILVDARGRRLAGQFAATAPTTAGYEEFLRHGDGSVAQALTTRIPGGGRLVVAADRALLAETDRDLIILFIAAFGAMLLLGVASAWTVGTVTRRRLNRIDATALAIIGGDLTRRMPIDGSGSEFDRVSTTLNRMLDRIAALMENLRQVSSDVAHDLRTPLTRLNNRLDEALATRDEGGCRDAIGAASRQAAELLEIFAALLRISEIETMGVRRHFRTVALGQAISELVETYRPDAEASGHVLTASIDPTASISGDRRLLLQLVSNLLDNALRHTPAGTSVKVALLASGAGARLTIMDDGPGVDPVETDRLFQRFTRSERSRSTEGHGLGLALVKAIALAHHGSVTLEPGPGFGVRIDLAST